MYGAVAMVFVTAALVGLHQLHTRVRASTMKRILFLALVFMLAGCDDTKNLGDSGGGGGHGGGHAPAKKSHKMPVPKH